MGQASRGGTGGAVRPVIEAEAGRGDAGSAARLVAEEGSGGGAQECPASQTEVETLVPEPPRAGVEGVAEEESAPRAPVVEEARVLVPVEARDEGVVATVMAQAATEGVVPVVQLSDSSEEFGDSRDIDPAAAASAADRIAEFVSAPEEVLSSGMSEGPHHGAIIQSGVPLEFLATSRRRKPSGSRILRPAPRFWAISTVPWSSTE